MKNKSSFEIFILKEVVLGRYKFFSVHRKKKLGFGLLVLKYKNFKCQVEPPFFTEMTQFFLAKLHVLYEYIIIWGTHNDLICPGQVHSFFLGMGLGFNPKNGEKMPKK